VSKALVALLVVLVAGAAAGLAFVRWPGDAGSYGNGVGGPLRIGSVFDTGLMQVENHGRTPLTIDEIRLHRPDGLALVGALATPRNPVIGSAHGWPPPSPVHLVPARGYRVPAHGLVNLVIGLRAVRPGSLRVEGVDVLYHRSIFGVTLKLRDHVGVWVGVCARRTAVQPSCDPPPFPR
jgi:hypothetical protein